MMVARETLLDIVSVNVGNGLALGKYSLVVSEARGDKYSIAYSS